MLLHTCDLHQAEQNREGPIIRLEIADPETNKANREKEEP
jgi:hypothetical protein